MSIFGSLMGGLFGEALNIGQQYASSAIQAHYQRQLMEKQDQLNRDFTVDQYSLKREGLEQANLNPILAAQGGFEGSANSVTATGAMPVQSRANSVMQALQIANAQEEVKAKKQETENNEKLVNAQVKLLNNENVLQAPSVMQARNQVERIKIADELEEKINKVTGTKLGTGGRGIFNWLDDKLNAFAGRNSAKASVAQKRELNDAYMRESDSRRRYYDAKEASEIQRMNYRANKRNK